MPDPTPFGQGPFQLLPARTARTAPAQLVAVAGHEFLLHIDYDLSIDIGAHLLRVLPLGGLAASCKGIVTEIRVRYSTELFGDRSRRLAAAPADLVTVHGAPYRRAQLGTVDWWQPATPDRQGDHLYARTATGQLHLVLRPGGERTERHLIPLLTEIALACGTARGWTAIDAWAAAIKDHGVLIAGSEADAVSVLIALAAHRRADLIAAGRALLTEQAQSVVGVPMPLRVPRPVLTALAPRRVPPHRDDGEDTVACSPRDVADAFAAESREEAPIRLVVLPRIEDSDQPVRIATLAPAAAREALAAACRAPDGTPWPLPCADHVPGPAEVRRCAAEAARDVAARVPVMTLTAGLRARHALEQIADAVSRRLA